MPLIDSFQVDHTIMRAPSVRLAKSMHTPHGDEIEVYDLRFLRPNEGMMPGKGIHTLEHFFASFMREHVNSPRCEVIDISPMGCRTGFYMSLIGHPEPSEVAAAMESALRDLAGLDPDTRVPAANPYQCGSYEYHSLAEAQGIARTVLERGIVVNLSEDMALGEDKLRELDGQ
ncbi:MAG: S-ribosylhomocysteine lyase [Succinivibrionaceae bacterium]|nr:S-ribosylhomocysteine lyase [Succinivibrionaceae bacterium]